MRIMMIAMKMTHTYKSSDSEKDVPRNHVPAIT